MLKGKKKDWIWLVFSLFLYGHGVETPAAAQQHIPTSQDRTQIKLVSGTLATASLLCMSDLCGLAWALPRPVLYVVRYGVYLVSLFMIAAVVDRLLPPYPLSNSIFKAFVSAFSLTNLFFLLNIWHALLLDPPADAACFIRLFFDQMGLTAARFFCTHLSFYLLLYTYWSIKRPKALVDKFYKKKRMPNRCKNQLAARLQLAYQIQVLISVMSCYLFFKPRSSFGKHAVLSWDLFNSQWALLLALVGVLLLVQDIVQSLAYSFLDVILFYICLGSLVVSFMQLVYLFVTESVPGFHRNHLNNYPGVVYALLFLVSFFTSSIPYWVISLGLPVTLSQLYYEKVIV